MGFDFQITRNPVTGKQEMNFLNGDFETITEAEECLQRIETALSTVLGEYKFDNQKGLPIFDQMFRKGQNQDLIRNYLRNAIRGVRGVRSVTELTLEPLNKERIMKGRFTAIYKDGTIINGDI